MSVTDRSPDFNERTVLRREHRSVKTACLSWQVVMYVIARTPCTGRVSITVSLYPFVHLIVAGLTRWHVHRLACQRQKQAYYLTSVALQGLVRSHCRVATNTTLPNRVRDLTLRGREYWNSEVGEEEQIEQSVNQLFTKRLHILVLFPSRRLVPRALRLCFVKEDFARNLRLSGLPSATGPEELLFPVFKVFGFVDKGEQSGEDPNAVQNVTIGS